MCLLYLWSTIWFLEYVPNSAPHSYPYPPNLSKALIYSLIADQFYWPICKEGYVGHFHKSADWKLPLRAHHPTANGCTEVALFFFCIQATAVSAPTFETHPSSPPLHCVLVKIHCNAHRQLLRRSWPVYRGGVPCINGLWRGHRQTFEEKNFDKKPFLVLLFIFSKQFFSEPFRADVRIYFNFAAKVGEERQLVAGD